MEVLPPCGTSGTPCRAASRTIVATSSVEAGCSRAGRPPLPAAAPVGQPGFDLARVRHHRPLPSSARAAVIISACRSCPVR
jgi:hypothetical protein